MLLIDIIILIILAGFVWKGIRLGLIETVGGIVGLFVGVFLASLYYDQVGNIFQGFLFGSETLADIVGFIVAFVLVNRAVAILFWIIDKIFNIIAIIPFLKTFNRLLGGILGLVEGIIFIGIVVYVLSFFSLTSGFQQSVDQSKFANILKTVGKIASPFISDKLKNWQDYQPLYDNIKDDLRNIPSSYFPNNK